MIREYVITNDPIEDLQLSYGTAEPHVQVTEAQVRALGATDADIYEARKGYQIVCETASIEMLDTLINGYGD